jgi:hypothetical protein
MRLVIDLGVAAPDFLVHLPDHPARLSGGEKCDIDIRTIQESGVNNAAVQIANSPDFIKNAISVRRVTVPIVDMHLLMFDRNEPSCVEKCDESTLVGVNTQLLGRSGPFKTGRILPHTTSARKAT